MTKEEFENLEVGIMISKPRCFLDLLELQQMLDNEVSKPRENGFVPKKRNKTDYY